MRQYLISTDTTADLTDDFVRENSIDIHTLFYAFGEQNSIHACVTEKCLLQWHVIPKTLQKFSKKELRKAMTSFILLFLQHSPAATTTAA